MQDERPAEERRSPEALAALRETMPGQPVIYDVAELFKACADPTRAAIMCALMRNELCVNDIAELLYMTSSAISHQLRLLKHMYLVKSRRAGKSVFYTLADDHIEEIFQKAFEHVLEEDRSDA